MNLNYFWCTHKNEKLYNIYYCINFVLLLFNIRVYNYNTYNMSIGQNNLNISNNLNLYNYKKCHQWSEKNILDHVI